MSAEEEQHHEEEQEYVEAEEEVAEEAEGEAGEEAVEPQGEEEAQGEADDTAEAAGDEHEPAEEAEEVGHTAEEAAEEGEHAAEDAAEEGEHAAEAEQADAIGTCAQCSGDIVDEDYSKTDELLLHNVCVEAWQEAHCPRCAHCEKIITSSYVELDNMKTNEPANIHDECVDAFKAATRPFCKGCSKQLLEDDMSKLDGDFYHGACADEASKNPEPEAKEEEKPAAPGKPAGKKAKAPVGKAATKAPGKSPAKSAPSTPPEEKPASESSAKAAADKAAASEAKAKPTPAPKKAPQLPAGKKAPTSNLVNPEDNKTAESGNSEQPEPATTQPETEPAEVKALAPVNSIAAAKKAPAKPSSKKAPAAQPKKAPTTADEQEKPAAAASASVPAPPVEAPATQDPADKKATPPAPKKASKAVRKAPSLSEPTPAPEPTETSTEVKPEAKPEEEVSKTPPAPKASGKKMVKKTSVLSAGGAPPAPAPKQNQASKKEEPKQAEAKKASLDEYDAPLSAPGHDTVADLFKRLDFNGNGMLSLAELDKAVIELWPKYNHKPAIMRAYKAADENGTGFVSKREFELFLEFLVIFQNTWLKFAKLDTSGDRRLTEEEFVKGAVELGIEDHTEEDLKQMFDDMDNNDGGFVLFDEFCAVFAKKGTQHLRKAKSPEPLPPKKPVAEKKESGRPKPVTAAVSNSTSVNSSQSSPKFAGEASMGTTQTSSNGGKKKNLPIVETPLAQPKHKPKPPPTPEEDIRAKLNLPKPKKVRLVGDPTVEALEARVRERRAAERLRHEEMMRKAQQAQEEFERRQAEREREQAERLAAERAAKEAEFQRRHEERMQAEAERAARLAGRVKVDLDIITGQKSIAEKFQERAKELEEEEERIRKEKLEARKSVCATGPEYYKALAEHEQKIRLKKELDEKERAARKLELAAVPPLPQEYQTKVRQKILEQDEQAREQVINHREISHVQRAKRLGYAAEVREKHVPKSSGTYVPPEEKKTAPRGTRDTRNEGNHAIRRADYTGTATKKPVEA